jgi:hypothetical protein
MTGSEQTACKGCGRALTSAASIARGRGRTCHRRAVAEATYSAAQVAKAQEVVELGAIAPTGERTTRRHLVFAVVASDGVARYRTTCTACTCPAGRKARRCYHRLAAVYAA